MRRSRLKGSLAGLLTVVVFALLLLVWRPFAEDTRGQGEKKPPREPERPTQPVAMTSEQNLLVISMGLKDTAVTDWNGSVQVSGGKLGSLQIIQGHPKAAVDGDKFILRTIKPAKTPKQLKRPILQATIDGPTTSKVSVKTAQGDFTFAIADVPRDDGKQFLEGQVSVTREEGAARLTGADTEDDYPALARGAGDTAWLVYNEYVAGPPALKERILAGGFEALVPQGNGDQLRLMRFDGKQWYPSEPVTEPGLNIWRPTVAVDGKGAVTVAWSQQVDGDWEILYRRYVPGGGDNAAGQWSKAVRLTNAAGSDFHVVAAADAKGTVWLGWQSWRDGKFGIQLAALAKGHPYTTPKTVSGGNGNCWCPSLATDSKGNVFVAWDEYDGTSYNVNLHKVGDAPRTLPVARSARFEARPNIVCDAQDRVWIAYEEGDEQWGKDYANAMFQKIGLKSNPGFGLYINRTVQVKCLDGDKLLEPSADLQEALGRGLTRKKSLPRLVMDNAGGLWLWLRHHPQADGKGEVWNSFALRYDGKAWTAPRRIASSANLLDNRPALLAHGDGILEAHSGDDRVKSQQRKQTDLFAVLVSAQDKVSPPELVAAKESDGQNLKPVHPNEAADVARIRNYTIEHAGKNLRLFRGEFHRHTEYSAHTDIDGLLEDSFRYALDAGLLDWMGNGDHDNGFNEEYPWWQIQKWTDIVTHPPHFVGALTYERSNKYPNGHRNVMLPVRGTRPLPRGNLEGTPENGTPDTKMLFAYLRRFGGICASHTSGTDMGTDWRDNDPVVEPVVEIYQGHRHNYEHFGAPRSATQETNIGGYQKAGYVWNAFDKGYKFGFQASSDHISTHMSYAVVLTDDLSRKGLIEAFKRRHSYGATDNIILDVRSGPHIMGDAFATDERPTLDVKVIGTGPIAKLHVIRNNRYVYSDTPNKNEVKLRFTDNDAEPGQTAYYYVRVEQADTNLAWASPMWITYNKK